MRHALRRIAIGVLGTGMTAAMALGATSVAANAAVTSQQSAAVAQAQPNWRVTWPTVKYGDRGVRVRTVQYLLDAHGANLIVTGFFGTATVHAVKVFQIRHHLFPDGKVGNATWPKLIITVRWGSHGLAVRAVQDQLRNAYHYYYVKVTGFFNRKTKKAVKDFQFRHRMAPDGIVGPCTWNALVKYDS
jgi:peptidoglycan hydrolase-like protein with peptidoglycan-binding domain